MSFMSVSLWERVNMMRKRRSRIAMLFVFFVTFFNPLRAARSPERFAFRLSGGISYLLIGDTNRGIQAYFDYHKDLAFGSVTISLKRSSIE